VFRKKNFFFERKLTHLYLRDQRSSDHAWPIAAGPEVAGNQATAAEGTLKKKNTGINKYSGKSCRNFSSATRSHLWHA